MFRHYSKWRASGPSPEAINNIVQVEEDPGTPFTYDQVLRALRMLRHLIWLRRQYDECDTIKVMCHDKDYDEQGMGWLPGTVKQALLGCQIAIDDDGKTERWDCHVSMPNVLLDGTQPHMWPYG